MSAPEFTHVGGWTHAICGACWNKRHPERLADRLPADGPGERCCFCGLETRSGIFFRHAPDDGVLCVPKPSPLLAARAVHAALIERGPAATLAMDVTCATIRNRLQAPLACAERAGDNDAIAEIYYAVALLNALDGKAL